jgi:hypothetical protein
MFLGNKRKNRAREKHAAIVAARRIINMLLLANYLIRFFLKVKLANSLIMLFAFIFIFSSLSQTHGKTGVEEGKVSVGYGAGYTGKDTKAFPFLDSSSIDSAKSDTCTIAHYLRGKRSKAEVLRTIMTNLAKMKSIYQNRIKLKPGLSGYMFVTFQIVSSGTVIKSEVNRTSILDSLFESQITDYIMTLKFPEMADMNDTTEIVYPFILPFFRNKENKRLIAHPCAKSNYARKIPIRRWQRKTTLM